MATGTIKDGIISTRVLQQNSATFGTTYPFDLTGYKVGIVWINQSGWRDSLVLPIPLFSGAYGMSTGGDKNTVRVDITPTSILVQKIDGTIPNNFDLQIYGLG